MCWSGIEDVWSRGRGHVGKRASPYGGKAVLVSGARCAAGSSTAVPVRYRCGSLVAAIEHMWFDTSFSSSSSDFRSCHHLCVQAETKGNFSQPEFKVDCTNYTRLYYGVGCV